MKSGWDVFSLGDVEDMGLVKLGRGKVISKKDLNSAPGNYPVYSAAKDNDGKFGEYGHYMFDEELITWTVDGGGRLFHRPKHKFSITNVGGFVRVLEKSKVNYKFLFYSLSYNHGKINFDWVKKAHPSVIRRLYDEIPLPPLEEQKRIVAVLDAAFEGLDRARAHVEANLQNARDLFESTLETLYSKPFDRSAKLNSLIKISHGFAFKSKDFEVSQDTSRPVVLTPGNYTENAKIDVDRSKTKRLIGDAPQEYIFDIGELTVVMTDLSSKMKILGKPAFIEHDNILHNQRIGRIEFLGPSVTKKFLYYFLRTKGAVDAIKDTATGTMVRHTAPKRILDLEILFPSGICEQKNITDTLHDVGLKVGRASKSYQAKLADLDDLRQSLLQKAFAGELT